MEKYKVVIAEDEIPSQNRIKDLCKPRMELDIIKVIDNGCKVIDFSKNNELDLVLLDVELPGLTGIEVLEILKEYDIKPYIIFTTAYDKYAIKAFDYAAIDFLLKPISKKRFNIAIDKFIEIRRKNLISIKSLSNYYNSLSENEKIYFKLFQKKKSNREIMKEIGCEEPALYMYKNRIIKKFKKYYSYEVEDKNEIIEFISHNLEKMRNEEIAIE